MSVILQGPRARVASTLFRFDARECVDEAGLYGLSYGKRVAAVLSRPSRKRVADQRGRLFTVPVGAPAIGLFGGEAGVLLEAEATNPCTRSQEFEAWGGNSGGETVTPNVSMAPDGTVTMDLLAGNGATGSQGYFRALPFTSDGTKCLSIFLKQGTGDTRVQLALYDANAVLFRHAVMVTWVAGVPTLTALTGSGELFVPEWHLNGGWRVSFTANDVVAANANYLYIYTAGASANAGSVYAWGAQAENGRAPSSYIPTAATAVTRGIDSCSFDIPGLNPPRAMTMYVRGVNRGAGRDGGQYLFIANTALGAPWLLIANNGVLNGSVFGQWSDGTLSSSTSTSDARVGDVVEWSLSLSAEGVAQMSYANNGEVPTIGFAGTAVPLLSSFSTPTRLNIAGPLAPSRIQVAEGVRSLAEMRELAGI